MLGQDNPGRVTWAPRVFDMAKDYGLVLLENGALVDTAAGEVVPADAVPMAPTTRAAADALGKMTGEQAETIVWRHSHPVETNVIGIIGEDAPLDWDHGFQLDRIDIAPGETIDWDAAEGHDVLFVHSGDIGIECSDGFLSLNEGDTISMPAGFARLLTSQAGATAFLVHI